MRNRLGEIAHFIAGTANSFVKSKRLRWLSLATILATLFVAGALRSAARPRLEVDSEKLSLGEIWETSDFKYELPIKNPSDVELHVASFETSCGCAVVESPSVTIPAHETRRVVLAIDLYPAQRVRRLGDSESGDEPTDFMVTVTPRIQTSHLVQDPEPVWVLRGRIKKLLKFDSGSIVFPDVFFSNQDDRTPQTVRVTSALPLKDLAVEVVPDVAEVDVRPEGPSGKEFVVTLRRRPSLPEGYFSGLLRLRPLGNDGPLPISKFEFGGRIRPDIEAVPPLISFSTERVREGLNEVVTLRASKSQSFEVVRVDFDAKRMNVQASAPASGTPEPGSKQFEVGLRMPVGSSLREDIVFHVRTSQSRMSQVRVPVNYFHLTPDE